VEEKNQRDVALVLHITARHILSDQKTNVTTVTYAAQFREGVTRVDPSDFILSSPDGAYSNIFSVSGSSADYFVYSKQYHWRWHAVPFK
jgi:hypothetical protein